MMSVSPNKNALRIASVLFALLLSLAPIAQLHVAAQTPGGATSSNPTESAQSTESSFRLERMPVAGGAELLTIFGNLDGLSRESSQTAEVPMVSILRDTLGDTNPENDRLRYLWMLTYTRPSLSQRLAAGIPFLYSRAGNKGRAGKGTPPHVIDLAATEREVWQKIFWSALQNILLDGYGLPLKASTRAYRRNLSDYRKAHLMRALSLLSLYQATEGGSPAFTETELRDIQARLMLTEKTLGGIVDDIYLQRVYQQQTTATRDIRGHNWELLRQRAEAESLYFEPLEMPDGSATHALLWVARPDLATNRGRAFDKRFLNISNPWRDERLLYWEGYTETRYFDSENRAVAPGTTGARAVQMIPLALYGLDHPKIPIMLVDFRDSMNPKMREMSRRVLEDVTRTVLSLSRFGDLPYFLSRTVYDFVTGRRGMDINQPSRVRTYSQLKLLLSLSASLDPKLRDEIDKRMERVSLNPLENDMLVEAQLARDQYKALVEYARRPDGLPAQLDKDRREEMMPLVHGGKEQKLLRLANVMTFGLYTHREQATPELVARMELQRRLGFHERFLREVAKSPRIEIEWNIEDVRRSLRFVSENSAEAASSRLASTAAQIFARTEDEATRSLALSSLYRINNETAKKELLRIHNDEKLEARWRDLSADYLRRAVREKQVIAPEDAKAIVSVVGQ